ncbi:MAG: hypothetical protein QOE90_393 [Thermoplasmata archaeon]|nr:hypothetical protein [Thermoplasmata archaeon]
MEPRFFANPERFRAWLAKNHANRAELLVGFWKVGSGKRSMTWAEAVDEALAFGWIDGVRKRIDDESYQIRFTPRKAGSHWSKVNVAHVARLRAEGRMTPAGEAAFAARAEAKTARASYENRDAAKLPPAMAKRLRADAAAWAYWSARPPSYRRAAAWWVVSAKREETRERRFATLLADCAAGRPIKPLSY